MKISQMLAREPLDQTLAGTLARYWTQRYGISRSVRWYPRRGWNWRRNGTEQMWPCLPELNAILPPDAAPPVRHWVRSMFANTPVAWRRPLLQAYVAGATAPGLAGIVARAALEVSPPVDNTAFLLIWPGNARLRLFDFERGRVAVILKVGFEAHSAMQRELEVRSSNPAGEWPIPPVLAFDPAGTWFEEPILAGVVINRCPPGVEIRPLVAQAFSTLACWLDESRVECQVIEYAERLQTSVRNHLEQITVLNDQAQILVKHWLEAAMALIHRLAEQTAGTIELAIGHGDFQPGNIQAQPDGQVWLLDWEHSDRRQYLYDFLVFGLRSRFSTGLAGRLAGLLTGSDKDLLYPELWRTRLPGKQSHLRLLLLIFLIEELAWYLRENANPLFQQPSAGWLQFSRELAPALAYLNETT